MCLCLIKVRFVLTVEALCLGRAGGVEGKLRNFCEDEKTTITGEKKKST